MRGLTSIVSKNHLPSSTLYRITHWIGLL
jgi:hypothetical protein